ncbi:hypothetical protein DHEL01_v210869 [Diaporthe helianthi]|uniref:Uncharacterized protein n=1 Tax=Diaporthe helianthi TaxID=158607 RepID=A0A2P5HKE9_DIAHE|nr:hypothetical protein DHEL01_v210869 [Diaporthe helianthi]
MDTASYACTQGDCTRDVEAVHHHSQWLRPGRLHQEGIGIKVPASTWLTLETGVPVYGVSTCNDVHTLIRIQQVGKNSPSTWHAGIIPGNRNGDDIGNKLEPHESLLPG